MGSVATNEETTSKEDAEQREGVEQPPGFVKVASPNKQPDKIVSHSPDDASEKPSLDPNNNAAASFALSDANCPAAIDAKLFKYSSSANVESDTVEGERLSSEVIPGKESDLASIENFAEVFDNESSSTCALSVVKIIIQPATPVESDSDEEFAAPPEEPMQDPVDTSQNVAKNESFSTSFDQELKDGDKTMVEPTNIDCFTVEKLIETGNDTIPTDDVNMAGYESKEESFKSASDFHDQDWIQSPDKDQSQVVAETKDGVMAKTSKTDLDTGPESNEGHSISGEENIRSMKGDSTSKTCTEFTQGKVEVKEGREVADKKITPDQEDDKNMKKDQEVDKNMKSDKEVLMTASSEMLGEKVSGTSSSSNDSSVMTTTTSAAAAAVILPSEATFEVSPKPETSSSEVICPERFTKNVSSAHEQGMIALDTQATVPDTMIIGVTKSETITMATTSAAVEISKSSGNETKDKKNSSSESTAKANSADATENMTKSDEGTSKMTPSSLVTSAGTTSVSTCSVTTAADTKVSSAVEAQKSSAVEAQKSSAVKAQKSSAVEAQKPSANGVNVKATSLTETGSGKQQQSTATKRDTKTDTNKDQSRSTGPAKYESNFDTSRRTQAGKYNEKPKGTGSNTGGDNYKGTAKGTDKYKGTNTWGDKSKGTTSGTAGNTPKATSTQITSNKGAGNATCDVSRGATKDTSKGTSAHTAGDTSKDKSTTTNSDKPKEKSTGTATETHKGTGKDSKGETNKGRTPSTPRGGDKSRATTSATSTMSKGAGKASDKPEYKGTSKPTVSDTAKGTSAATVSDTSKTTVTTTVSDKGADTGAITEKSKVPETSKVSDTPKGTSETSKDKTAPIDKSKEKVTATATKSCSVFSPFKVPPKSSSSPRKSSTSTTPPKESTASSLRIQQQNSGTTSSSGSVQLINAAESSSSGGTQPQTIAAVSSSEGAQLQNSAAAESSGGAQSYNSAAVVKSGDEQQNSSINSGGAQQRITGTTSNSGDVQPQSTGLASSSGEIQQQNAVASSNRRGRGSISCRYSQTSHQAGGYRPATSTGDPTNGFDNKGATGGMAVVNQGCSKVLLSNLPRGWSDYRHGKFVRNYGKISAVKTLGSTKAVYTFENQADAAKAIAGLNNQVFDGQRIKAEIDRYVQSYTQWGRGRGGWGRGGWGRGYMRGGSYRGGGRGQGRTYADVPGWNGRFPPNRLLSPDREAQQGGLGGGVGGQRAEQEVGGAQGQLVGQGVGQRGQSMGRGRGQTYRHRDVPPYIQTTRNIMAQVRGRPDVQPEGQGTSQVADVQVPTGVATNQQSTYAAAASNQKASIGPSVSGTNKPSMVEGHRGGISDRTTSTENKATGAVSATERDLLAIDSSVVIVVEGPGMKSLETASEPSKSEMMSTTAKRPIATEQAVMSQQTTQAASAAVRENIEQTAVPQAAAIPVTADQTVGSALQSNVGLTNQTSAGGVTAAMVPASVIPAGAITVIQYATAVATTDSATSPTHPGIISSEAPLAQGIVLSGAPPGISLSSLPAINPFQPPEGSIIAVPPQDMGSLPPCLATAVAQERQQKLASIAIAQLSKSPLASLDGRPYVEMPTGGLPIRQYIDEIINPAAMPGEVEAHLRFARESEMQRSGLRRDHSLEADSSRMGDITVQYFISHDTNVPRPFLDRSMISHGFDEDVVRKGLNVDVSGRGLDRYGHSLDIPGGKESVGLSTHSPDSGVLSVDEEQVIRMVLPSFKIGPLIGRRGENIKQIQMESKATSIRALPETSPWSEQVVEIRGIYDTCGKALTRILQLELSLNEERRAEPAEQVELQFLVPDVYCGLLIGRNGRDIKDIRNQTNTRITISKILQLMELYPERMMTVKGEMNSVVAAQSKIRARLAEMAQKHNDALADGRLYVPQRELAQYTGPVRNYFFYIKEKYAGRIIGQQGATIRQIMNDSKAHVTVERKHQGVPQTNDQSRWVRITGSPESGFRAFYSIYDIMSQTVKNATVMTYSARTVMEIPRSMIARVLGKGGAKVREVQTNTTTSIHVAQADIYYDQRSVPVYINGCFINTQKAMKLIRDMITYSCKRAGGIEQAPYDQRIYQESHQGEPSNREQDSRADEYSNYDTRRYKNYYRGRGRGRLYGVNRRHHSLPPRYARQAERQMGYESSQESDGEQIYQDNSGRMERGGQFMGGQALHQSGQHGSNQMFQRGAQLFRGNRGLMHNQAFPKNVIVNRCPSQRRITAEVRNRINHSTFVVHQGMGGVSRNMANSERTKPISTQKVTEGQLPEGEEETFENQDSWHSAPEPRGAMENFESQDQWHMSSKETDEDFQNQDQWHQFSQEEEDDFQDQDHWLQGEQESFNNPDDTYAEDSRRFETAHRDNDYQQYRPQQMCNEELSRVRVENIHEKQGNQSFHQITRPNQQFTMPGQQYKSAREIASMDARSKYGSVSRAHCAIAQDAQIRRVPSAPPRDLQTCSRSRNDSMTIAGTSTGANKSRDVQEPSQSSQPMASTQMVGEASSKEVTGTSTKESKMVSAATDALTTEKSKMVTTGEIQEMGIRQIDNEILNDQIIETASTGIVGEVVAHTAVKLNLMIEPPKNIDYSKLGARPKSSPNTSVANLSSVNPLGEKPNPGPAVVANAVESYPSGDKPTSESAVPAADVQSNLVSTEEMTKNSENMDDLTIQVMEEGASETVVQEREAKTTGLKQMLNINPVKPGPAEESEKQTSFDDPAIVALQRGNAVV